LWIFVPEGGEALIQAQSVGGSDGEYSNAALRAARAAQEVRPAAFRGIGKGAIDERNESAVLALEMCLGMIRVGDGIGTHGSIVGQMLGVGQMPGGMRMLGHLGQAFCDRFSDSNCSPLQDHVAREGKRRL